MAIGGNGIDWRSVQADFSDSNQAMNVASGAFSQVGNVFDRISKSLADERKRIDDNEYRQKLFGLETDKFGLETDKFGHEQEQDAVKNAQWDKTHGLDRIKELNRMAERVSDDTGNVVRYGGATGNYSPLVNSISSNTGVPAFILNSMIQQESGGNPNAVSPTGVTGVAQVTIPIMKKYGYTAADRTDPVKSADAGARYLKDLHTQYGNWEDALIAYNGGDGAVQGIKTGTFSDEWKASMRKQGIDPEQKIREVQGYARMAKDVASQQQLIELGQSVMPQRSLKGLDSDAKSRAEQQIEADRRVVQQATAYANDAAKGFDTQVQNLNNRIREIDDIAGSTEYDALATRRQELIAQRDQAAKDSAKAVTESGRELLLMQKLEEMGRGDLTADLRSKRAAEERQHGRTLDTEKLKANAEWSKTLQDNHLAEDKAALATAKILSGIEDGIIGGKYNTDARTALSIARSLKRPDGSPITEQQILEAFSSFSTSDSNWFFDTPMQDAIQKFNENQTGPLAEALRFYGNPSNAGKELKSGESNGNTRQEPFNSVLEKRYGSKTLQDLRASGLTDSDISRLDRLAMLTAKGNQGIFKGTSNNLAQILGMDFIARKVFDSNVYSDPEPSPQDFQSALAIVQRQRQEANQRDAQRQADLKSRQQQFEQSIKK